MGHATTDPPVAVNSPLDLADRFCAGDAFARRLVGAGSEPASLTQGQALFHQGDPGDSMYLLLKGRLSVLLEHEDGTSTQLAELGPGAPVGELALLTGQPRTASVYALTDGELVRCSRSRFDVLAREHPDELAGFTRTITRRMQQVQFAGVVAGVFGVQDAQALDWLLQEMEWVQLSHGDVLFREGDPSEALYVVVCGRLRLSASAPDGGERVLGEVPPGETVGELGLLSSEARTATAVAIRETHVVRMSLPAFERLVERHPESIMRLARLIVRRQRSLVVRQAKPPRALAFALAPAGRDVQLGRFADELSAHLAAHGSVLTLDAGRLDAAVGTPGAAHAEAEDPIGLVVSAWLSEQETRYSYILYVAEPTWSAWSRRCVHQADRLLLVGMEESAPTPSLVESAIRGQPYAPRAELVLLHPAGTARPSGTAQWLVDRQVHDVHHVRMGDRSHFEGLARKLTGRGIGLVLSGGGARGFAHAGVIRALEELGIPIDRIGSSSMGAVIGGFFAMGWSFSEAFKIIQEYFAKRETLFDYTLPLVSLMATQKVTNAIMEVFGETGIEDLWTSFFCVSSNLTRAEPVVHRTGPLWKAVRTSIAIPGVYVPVLHDGDVLVDGAVMNNFPVDVMYDMSEGGTIIGVNVSPYRERAKAYSFGVGVSGWQVLRSRINPLGRKMKVPSLVGSISRAMEINSVHHLKAHQGLAELIIQPDVREFGILDFPSYEPIIDIGYRVGKEQLVSWLKERGSTFQVRGENDSPLPGLAHTLQDLNSVLDDLSLDGGA